MNGLLIKNVSHRYGNTFALDQVSLELPAGQVVALIGPNGCGKSTLLKLISGIVSSPSGRKKRILPSPNLPSSILWKGEALDLLPLGMRAQRVSYLGPDLQFDFPMTAYEAVMMGHIPHHPAASWQHSESEHRQVEAAMGQAECWSFRNRFIGELSGGEQQLVGLARILVQATPIVLLDETLSRMDLRHQVQAGRIMRDLTRAGRLVLLVSHDLNLSSEWADSAVLMSAGKVLHCGGLNETLTRSNLSAIYPGVPLTVAPNPLSGVPKVFITGSLGDKPTIDRKKVDS
jgi:iron complex transport system ATP-binding protein